MPAGTLKANQSYARVSDAADQWEVKGGSEDKYVTPSTNNKTIDSNAKMEKFEEHDSVGIGMAISAMSVVFCGLILLYISFKIIGKISVNLSKRNAMKAKGITDKQEAKRNNWGRLREKFLLPFQWPCTNSKAMYTMWKTRYLPLPV